MKTRKEKRAFIRALTKSVLKDVLDNVPFMPPEWGGLELREYLADRFARSCSLRHAVPNSFTGRSHIQRLREYRNDLLTRPL